MMPESLGDLTKPALNFIQAVARGVTDGVRIASNQLDNVGREQILRCEEFQCILAALQKESEWKPDPRRALNLFAPLDPELKELRAKTNRAVRRARRLAQNLVEATTVEVAPNVSGRHYQTAVALSGVLKTIPAISHILLFGSVARGEEASDSDVDLLIVRAPGMGDALFREILVETLDEVADMMEFPVIKIRADAFPQIDNPPEVQLLTIDALPRKWSERGIVEGELLILWCVDSAEAMLAARTGAAEVLDEDIGAAVLHERGWHWHEDQQTFKFTAMGVVEVFVDGRLELREIEVATPWYPTQRREIRCWFTAKGKYTTEWSDEMEVLVADVVAQWVKGKTGSEVDIISF